MRAKAFRRQQLTEEKQETSSVHRTAQELCGSRGGRPGLPVPNSLYSLYSLYGRCGRTATLNEHFQSELKSCVEVEVDVVGLPSLIDLVVSVDVKHHCLKEKEIFDQCA